MKTKSNRIILFCGLSGTLKTYLAVRVSENLGCVYLPTRVGGQLPDSLTRSELQSMRWARYEKVGYVAAPLADMGLDIVIDGGFMSQASRSLVLGKFDNNHRTIVFCYCGDEGVRRRRLAIRSQDWLDSEAGSARSILEGGEVTGRQDDPVDSDLADGLVNAVLAVDTQSYSLKWFGNPGIKFRDSLSEIVKSSLVSHRSNPFPAPYTEQVRNAFNELASTYNESTPWRSDKILLEHLRVDLDNRRPNKVLDIGTGTGIAADWYSEQGHVTVGLDPSPTMLSRASERVTVSVLGLSPPLPFLQDYFDLVLVRQSLHYSDPALLLHDTERVLKPGGLLIISCIVAESDRAKGLWKDYKRVTQPLRLEVFSENSLLTLLGSTGFTVERQHKHRLLRVETISELSQRVTVPRGGWSSFLERIVRLSATEAPLAEMKFDGNKLEFMQHWSTIHARKHS